jgi:hypothetical protein
MYRGPFGGPVSARRHALRGRSGESDPLVSKRRNGRPAVTPQVLVEGDFPPFIAAALLWDIGGRLEDIREPRLVTGDGFAHLVHEIVTL